MANPGPPPETQTKSQKVLTKHHSDFKSKVARHLQTKFEAYMSKMNDNSILDLYINKAEAELTVMGQMNFKNARRVTIDAAHAATSKPNPKHDLLQKGKNAGYTILTTVRRLVQKIKRNNQQVRFSSKPTVENSSREMTQQ